jgi:hypothetical protein
LALILIDKINKGKGARRIQIIKCCGKKSCYKNLTRRGRSTNATKSTMLVTKPTLKVKTITKSAVEAIKDTSKAQYDATVLVITATSIASIGPLSYSEQFTSVVTTTGRAEESVATEEPPTEKSQTGNY